MQSATPQKTGSGEATLLFVSGVRVENGIVKCGSKSIPSSQIASVDVSSTRVPNNLAQGLLVASAVFSYLLFSKAWGGSLGAFMSNLRYTDDAVSLLILALVPLAAAAWTFLKSERRRAFWITLWLSDRSSVRLRAHTAAEAEGLRKSVEHSLASEA